MFRGQKLSVTGTRLTSGESLIILSPDASRITAILGDDKRRWEIETLFKALKSQGSDIRSVAIVRETRNGVGPISGAQNEATAMAFGGPRASRRALRAAPGLPQ